MAIATTLNRQQLVLAKAAGTSPTMAFAQIIHKKLVKRGKISNDKNGGK
jgi:hypothetical protein